MWTLSGDLRLARGALGLVVARMLCGEARELGGDPRRQTLAEDLRLTCRALNLVMARTPLQMF